MRRRAESREEKARTSAKSVRQEIQQLLTELENLARETADAGNGRLERATEHARKARDHNEETLRHLNPDAVEERCWRTLDAHCDAD